VAQRFAMSQSIAVLCCRLDGSVTGVAGNALAAPQDVALCNISFATLRSRREEHDVSHTQAIRRWLVALDM